MERESQKPWTMNMKNEKLFSEWVRNLDINGASWLVLDNFGVQTIKKLITDPSDHFEDATPMSDNFKPTTPIGCRPVARGTFIDQRQLEAYKTSLTSAWTFRRFSEKGEKKRFKSFYRRGLRDKLAILLSIAQGKTSNEPLFLEGLLLFNFLPLI